MKLVGVLGIFSAVICLVIFGADNFLLPSLVITVLLLSVLKRYFTAERSVA